MASLTPAEMDAVTRDLCNRNIDEITSADAIEIRQDVEAAMNWYLSNKNSFRTALPNGAKHRGKFLVTLGTAVQRAMWPKRED